MYKVYNFDVFCLRFINDWIKSKFKNDNNFYIISQVASGKVE
jgi:hypothetical protein